MLGDFGPGGCGNQRDGGRYIEGPAGIPSRTAGVHQCGAFGICQRQCNSGRAHGIDESGQFVGGHATRSQCR